MFNFTLATSRGSDGNIRDPGQPGHSKEQLGRRNSNSRTDGRRRSLLLDVAVQWMPEHVSKGWSGILTTVAGFHLLPTSGSNLVSGIVSQIDLFVDAKMASQGTCFYVHLYIKTLDRWLPSHRFTCVGTPCRVGVCGRQRRRGPCSGRSAAGSDQARSRGRRV